MPRSKFTQLIIFFILFQLTFSVTPAFSFERSDEILVLSGAHVPYLRSFSIGYDDWSDKGPASYNGTIHAFAYRSSGGWEQIPMQIDIKNDGSYFFEYPVDSGNWYPFESNYFDDDDEIVVAVSDCGELAPDGTFPEPEMAFYPRYQIEVTDPLTAEIVYFYLFISYTQGLFNTSDYVENSVADCTGCPDDRFEGNVESSEYVVGFSEGNLTDIMNKTGGGSLDIFDNVLMWADISYPLISCAIPLNLYLDQGPSSQELVTSSNVGGVIDGTVRVILLLARNTDIDALDIHTTTYQEIHFSRYQIVLPMSVSDISGGSTDSLCSLALSLRFDFNTEATGMMYYDEYNQELIDGSPAPSWNPGIAQWRVVTGNAQQGTMVMTGSVPADLISNNLVSPLYIDNATYTEPHGRAPGYEAGHYGCNGIAIPDGLALLTYIQSNPGTYNLTQTFTFLPHTQGNVGALYYNRAANPLTIVTIPLAQPVPALQTWSFICILFSLSVLFIFRKKRQKGEHFLID